MKKLIVLFLVFISMCTLSFAGNKSYLNHMAVLPDVHTGPQAKLVIADKKTLVSFQYIGNKLMVGYNQKDLETKGKLSQIDIVKLYTLPKGIKKIDFYGHNLELLFDSRFPDKRSFDSMLYKLNVADKNVVVAFASNGIKGIEVRGWSPILDGKLFKGVVNESLIGQCRAIHSVDIVVHFCTVGF
ncbi:hypothetical protein [Xenorhabdus anantnagensis]|uniref:Uncharacterized protein n=1 Tax=Xenorhabdus anantnagensis TaxID=3025875 RepID=A0ABT5LWU5_9GAMM|nr:hypothetical protein [Xenorhabdus anantnagensis]MDC9598203.1 hypothetical protein [Xenorhabdus anantnagensis]